jgi:hypothetical protein
MSILEKLKDLVSALEENKEPEEPEEPEEIIPTEPQKVEEEEIEETPDYLECSEEESKEIHELLARTLRDKERVADIVMDFERKKLVLLNRIASQREELYNKLNSLRLEYGVPDEGYSVQLPSSPGEPVIFEKE